MIDLKDVKQNLASDKQRIIVYGPIGIGKSTFASCAEKPIFILTEDGLGDIPAAYVPFGENQERKVAATFEEVLDALASLGEQEHEYKTVVIDSLDWSLLILSRTVDSFLFLCCFRLLSFLFLSFVFHGSLLKYRRLWVEYQQDNCASCRAS